MRLSIATKIFLAFAAVVVIFTGVLMYGSWRTQTLYGRIQQLNHTVVPISLLLSDVQTDLKSFNTVLNERDPLVLRRTLQMTRLVHFLPDRFTGTLKRAHWTARRALADEMDPSQRETVERLATKIDELRHRAVSFSERSRQFTDLVLNEPPEMDRHAYADRLTEMQTELRGEARGLDEDIASLRSDLRSVTDQALARANDTQRSSLYALGALSAVALLIAVALLVVVLLTVRPLTALTEAARRIGEGDYRPIEDPPKSRLGADEITLLTREFNKMVESLADRDAKLREQHQQLLKSERLATVGRMTSLITHELRNPLSSINLNSEMLQETLVERGIGTDDAEVMPLLGTIIDEVDRLRDITEEYLVYARLPSPSLEPTDLSDIVESLIDFHLFEWVQAGVEINWQPPSESVSVMADANQLRQALLNIIKNAIEASPNGTSVDVEVFEDDGWAVVSVRDHGDGITDEEFEHIFDPFFTTKSNGTGLGLAMTQQIVEEHHGQMSVESAVGQGAAFVIKLPLQGRD
ncbi:MAG: ATP-binding protein [Persicimonas sp.]